jgi:hypothetical protein
MASKISGGVNHPVFVNRQSAEQAGGKAEAKQLPNARAARDTRFDGLGGADRAEMLRFMALKDGHQEQQGGAQAAVRNLGAATPLLFANQPEVSLADAAKGQFANYDLTTFDNLEKNVIDERDPAVFDALPASVRESYNHYFNHAEANDWGTVRIAKHQVAGEDVYMVNTTTDGSDNYMELFAADGRPLASGQAQEDDARNWDAEFGACRTGVIWE